MTSNIITNNYLRDKAIRRIKVRILAEKQIAQFGRC